MFNYIPLGPHMMSMSHSSGFEQHVFGMWIGFVFSAGTISYFVAGMASAVRRRELDLATVREQALRDERIVALGTLAAGAAHELGTPLGTIGILAEDIAQNNSLTVYTELQEKISIIQSQVSRCKEALSLISASAGEVRAESGQLLRADDYIKQLIVRWQNERPGVNLASSIQGSKPVPFLIAERALDQAIINILNNAHEASPGQTEIDVSWDQRNVTINIKDYGMGLDESVKNSAGKKLFSNKEHGLGMGLFLAHAVVERLGGEITLLNRDSMGVCTRIILPTASVA